jgi:hypothetical protein
MLKRILGGGLTEEEQVLKDQTKKFTLLKELKDSVAGLLRATDTTRSVFIERAADDDSFPPLADQFAALSLGKPGTDPFDTIRAFFDEYHAKHPPVAAAAAQEATADEATAADAATADAAATTDPPAAPEPPVAEGVLAIDDDLPVARLLSALEACLFHGICVTDASLAQKAGGATAQAAASFWALLRAWEATSLSPAAMSSPFVDAVRAADNVSKRRPSFVASDGTTRGCHAFVNTDAGRARSWLRLALEGRSLRDALSELGVCAGAEPLGAALPPAKASISGSSKPDPAGRAALLATYFVPGALLRCAIGSRMCLAIIDALCGGAGSGGTGGKGPTRGVGIAFRLDSNHPFLDDVRLAAPSGAKVGAWGGGGSGGGGSADGEGEGEGGNAAAAGQRDRGDSVTEVTKEVVVAVLKKAGEGVSSLADRMSATMAKAGQMQRNQFSAGRTDTADAAGGGAGGGVAEGVSLDDAAAAAAAAEAEEEQGGAGAKAAAVASAVGATVGAAAAKGAANAASAAAGAATAASGALRGLREKVVTAMAPKDGGGGGSATAADGDAETDPAAAAAAAAAASGDDAAADAEAAGGAASTLEEGGEGASVEEGGAEAPRKALIADGDL